MARSNLLLGVLLALLVATAALELTPALSGRRSLAPVPAAPVLAVTAAALGAEPTGAYVEQVLARPLFTEGRRPAAVVAVQAAQAAVDRPPRLSGILVTGNDCRAIFENSGKSVVGGIGTQMGAYRILAITPLGVTLQGPGGVQAIALSYGASAGGPAAPALPDQPSGSTQPPPGTPETPTFQEMIAKLTKRPPPVSDLLPTDMRPVR